MSLLQRLRIATRLFYELSSVVVKPMKRLLTPKKKEEKEESSIRAFSSPFVLVDYLDKIYLPLYYGLSVVTASSFYYSGYKLLGPALQKSALTALKAATAHPYSIGLSILLFSDLPIFFIVKGVAFVLTETGRWAFRRIF